MAALTWDAATMSTGDQEIDRQHRAIIQKLNELLEAMRRGEGQSQIAPILDFLTSYTIKHFTHEEHCMARAACPAAAANKAAHTRFIATVKTLRADYEKSGATTGLIVRVQRELGDWLRSHILNTDTQLRACVARAS